MKNIITKLNQAFENRVRLGIMSVLIVEEWVDFKALKETLNATDGNLASHLRALEKLGYIEVRKQFIGRKPNTSYAVSELGRKAFLDHIAALENLIKQNKK